jgi:CBS domain-containing protein
MFAAQERSSPMTVAGILRHKGDDIVAVRPTDTVARVAKVLTDRRIGAVLVQDAAEQLLGIVSERDIVHTLAAHGTRTLEMTAGQLMTRVLYTVTRQTTVPEAMSLMTEQRIRHLPVLEDGQLVGLVSIGDIVKARVTQQECEVDSLKAYVAGVA